MNKLRGTFTALITPMFSDGSVDYEGFRQNVKFQLDNGVTGLVPLGTTAETPTLEEDPGSEEDTLIQIVMEEVKAYRESTGKEIPVILGAGSNNTKDAVEYVERAKKVGADYALVVTPYYNKPSKEGIFRHFEAVSKVGLPIIVYNIKGRTGVNIPTDVLVRIAQLPNIAGVKEASGEISQMMDVIANIKNKKPDFAVLSGDDGLTLPLLAAGGDGVISVLSNLCPARMVELVDAGLKGDFAQCREYHYGLAPMFKAEFCDGNPTSIKYAMNYKGLPAGTVRLPLVEVTDSAKKTIEKAMDECNI